MPNRAYSRDNLVETIWPECELEVGRPRLRFTLTVLRQTFGLSDVLLTSKNEVKLDWSRVDTDVELFRRSIARADSQATGTERAQLLLSANKSLNGGLAEQYTSTWLDGPRADLQNTRIHALTQAAALLNEADQKTESEAALRDAIQIDPMRESLHHALMQQLADQSRPAEALAHYEVFRRRIQQALGLGPSELLASLAQAIGQSSPSQSVDAVKQAASSPRRRLYGRESLLEQIHEKLADNPLVALVGLGGSGKTSLATEIHQNRPFGEGHFVDLSDAVTAEDVYSALQTAYGVQRGDRGELFKKIGKAGGLLVLDNCEQVLEAAREFTTDVLREASGIRILATSRERLGSSAEHIIEVQGLSVPETNDAASLQELAESPSIQLLLRAANATNFGFSVTPANAADLIRLVRAVDGLPLSIELAAARLRLMPLTQILQMLDRGPEILYSAHRPARQRRVSDIVAWSISRLSDTGKRLLAHLSVFASGWDMGAVEAILETTPTTVAVAAETIDELLDNSLICPMSGHRFRMLESIRPVAMQYLQASGEEAEAREKHFYAFLRKYDNLGEWWTTSENVVWLARIGDDLPNLRIALQWATHREENDQIGERLSCAIWRYWSSAGSLDEGYKLFRGLLDAHPGQPRNKVNAELLSAVSRLEMRLGQHDAASKTQEESLEIFRALGDKSSESMSLRVLGEIGIQSRDPEKSERFFRESMALAEQLVDSNGVRICLDGLGRCYAQQNNHAKAIEFYRLGADLSMQQMKETGDHARPIPTLNNLGDSLIALGDLAAAEEYLDMALQLAKHAGELVGQSVILINLGSLALELDDVPKARRLYNEALTLRREIGEPKRIARAWVKLGLTSITEQNYDEADRCLHLAIGMLDPIDEPFEASIPRVWSSFVCTERGDLIAAARLARQALDAIVSDASSAMNALALLQSSIVLLALDRLEEGAVLLGASQAAQGEGLTPRLERRLEEQALLTARDALEERLDALLASGRKMEGQEALGKAASWLHEAGGGFPGVRSIPGN